MHNQLHRKKSLSNKFINRLSVIPICQRLVYDWKLFSVGKPSSKFPNVAKWIFRPLHAGLRLVKGSVALVIWRHAFIRPLDNRPAFSGCPIFNYLHALVISNWIMIVLQDDAKDYIFHAQRVAEDFRPAINAQGPFSRQRKRASKQPAAWGIDW